MTDQVTAASPAADETPPANADTATAAQTSAPDASAAESSPAGDTPSIFDAVKASLTTEGDKEAPPASAKPDTQATETKPEQTEGEEDDHDDKGELSEDEKKVLSAKTQRRIVKLARQRDEERVVAERTRQMDTFMQNHGIAREDAIGAFEVMALMRTKPAEALTRLREISYQLSLSIGETIPRDIQEKIDAGTIDEATGKELAIARAQAGGFKQATETLTAQSQAEQERTTKASITQDVNAWEMSVTKRDPDFAAKKPLIETHFRALLQAGEQLRTPADAVRLMKKAYELTNENTKTFRPAVRTEVKHQSATSTSAAAVAPKSYEEAIRGSFAA